MDFYYPVLAFFIGVGAYILTWVAQRYVRTKQLTHAQWVDEMEHALIERIRAGVYLAACDENLMRLMEKSPLPRNEATYQLLEIAKRAERTFHERLQQLSPSEQKATPALTPAAAVTSTAASEFIEIGGQLIRRQM